MEVVLLKEVAGLGHAGQVVKVAPGYAQNFLIPRKLAKVATEGALRQLQVEEVARARRVERQEKELEELAGRLEGVEVRLGVRVGEGDRLYGSITSQDIAAALEKAMGEPVDRRRVELEEPIRELGTFRVSIRLKGELAPRIKVVVERED